MEMRYLGAFMELVFMIGPWQIIIFFLIAIGVSFIVSRRLGLIVTGLFLLIISFPVAFIVAFVLVMSIAYGPARGAHHLIPMIIFYLTGITLSVVSILMITFGIIDYIDERRGRLPLIFKEEIR